MAYVEIVGAGPGTPPSVLLVTDTKRYLFNAGEGLQRFCMANRVRLVKLTDVFLTQLGIGQYGGVPGLFLTLSEVICGQQSPTASTGPAAVQSSQPDRIRVFGPPGLQAVVEATRAFASHAALTLQAQELAETRAAFFADQNLAMDVVVVRTPPRPACPRKRSRDAVADPVPDPDLLESGSEAESDAPALCYLVRMADTPGKFNVARARDLGVPRGPDYARLVAGDAVTLADGRQVRPDQVVGPARPGAAFVVLACPTRAHWDALRTARFPDAAAAAVLVVHLSPPSVSGSAEYGAWARTCWPAPATHLFTDEGAHLSPGAYRCSAAQQFALHRLCAESFAACPRSPSLGGETAARPRTRYVLPPHKAPGLDTSLVQAEPDFDQIDSFITSLTGMAPLLDALRDRQQTVTESAADAAELLFLGTGAAAPSKYRNSSGISLTLPLESRPHVLLDCGEGVLGQLYRVYGDGALLDGYLRGLRLVWISHHHADHHVGLLSLIRARTQVQTESDPDLVVLAPSRVLAWLRAFAGHGSDRLRCRLAHCTDTASPARAAVQHALGLARFESVPVQHCSESFGVVVEHDAGGAALKVVYSGDTRPSPALIAAGRGATVLIHEATFEDELEDEAVLKWHSTTREALDVGRRMQARETILTHFSQRYPKLPCTTDPSICPSSICMAFDLMRIRLDRIGILPALLPPLRLLFDESHKLPI